MMRPTCICRQSCRARQQAGRPSNGVDFLIGHPIAYGDTKEH